MKARPLKQAFDLTSGRLCLDFANTLEHRFSSPPQERLTGFAALVAFGQQAEALSPLEARKLQHHATQSARQASELFQHAIALRELLFRIFSAVAGCRQVSEADVKTFNAAVRRSRARSLVIPGEGKNAWQWLDNSSAADRLIGKIVRSAVEVLTSADSQRLKKCAADDCGWLFLDDSRSRNRRWCEMRTCGSRHKARAYYRRRKAAPRSVST